MKNVRLTQFLLKAEGSSIGPDTSSEDRDAPVCNSDVLLPPAPFPSAINDSALAYLTILFAGDLQSYRQVSLAGFRTISTGHPTKAQHCTKETSKQDDTSKPSAVVHLRCQKLAQRWNDSCVKGAVRWAGAKRAGKNICRAGILFKAVLAQDSADMCVIPVLLGTALKS
jgi:hypothetical protein